MTKQNLKEIMVRAHEIARSLEGDYAACLSYGLRQAWFEARLIAAGGARWQKNGMDRIYINDLARWFGLEVDYYKSGNICSAKLDGERISNNQAGKILSRLAMARVYYDCLTGRFEGKSITAEDLECIVEAITGAAQGARVAV
ncbi:MAG: hypothetical protein ACOY93_08470 [Bacillota bacterium]